MIVDLKKILWVSRHTMTDEQEKELIDFYGDVQIIQLDETVSDINKIISYNADIYAVVLPVDLIAELKNKTNAEIIRPVSERIKTDIQRINPATDKYESEYVFKHIGWQKIIKAEIKTEFLKERLKP